MPAFNPSTHNDRIDINVTLAATNRGRATLTTILVLQDGITPGGDIFAEYANLTEVADDVDATNLDTVSQAIAGIMFGQPNPPEKIVFGQVGELDTWELVIDTATDSEVYGVDMSAPAAADINFTAGVGTTAALIAAGIAAAWNADATCAAAATAVADGVDTVTFTSLTQDTLTLAEDENNAKMTLTQVTDTAEAPADALDRLIAAGAEFYGVLYASRTVARQILCATAVEDLASSGSKFIFGFQSHDTDWKGGTFPSAWSAIEEYERTVGYFHDDNDADASSDYLDAASFADRLSWDPDVTSAPWNGAVEEVDALTTSLTQTQKANLRTNHMNTALPMGTTTDTYVDPGENMNGRPVDHIVSADWFETRLGEDLQNLFVTKSARGEKIPMDAEGQALVGGTINAKLLEGVAIGHFSGSPTVTPVAINQADIDARRFRFNVDATETTGALGAQVNVYFSA